jgi:hypothetical protein
MILISVLFNDAVKSLDYIALVIDGWLGIKQWWNDNDDNDMGKPKFWIETHPGATMPTENPIWIAWEWNWASALEVWQLTALAMAHPSL